MKLRRIYKKSTVSKKDVEQLKCLGELLKAVIMLDRDILNDHSRHKYQVKVKTVRPFEWNIQTVGYLNSIKFEVRSAESPHNTPHFHVTIPGVGSGSYKIEDFSKIEGNIKRKDEKIIQNWALEHSNVLKAIWNEFHGHKVTVH